jgi:hypothetical protein
MSQLNGQPTSYEKLKAEIADLRKRLGNVECESSLARAHGFSMEREAVRLCKERDAVIKERDDLRKKLAKSNMDNLHMEASVMEYEYAFEADGCRTAFEGGCLELNDLRAKLELTVCLAQTQAEIEDGHFNDGQAQRAEDLSEYERGIF